MEPTQEVLNRYIGGQLEVQNPREGYLFRGEIATIELTQEKERDDRELRVTFAWFAKRQDDGSWNRVDPIAYNIALMIYTMSLVGEERIVLHSSITGELAVLFLPSGSKLDPAKVHGLVLQG